MPSKKKVCFGEGGGGLGLLTQKERGDAVRRVCVCVCVVSPPCGYHAGARVRNKRRSSWGLAGFRGHGRAPTRPASSELIFVERKKIIIAPSEIIHMTKITKNILTMVMEMLSSI